jgi:hypothetical protein
MFIAVFVRRLRPGKTAEDFVDAWYPDKGFGFPGRGPFVARNIEGDREILTVGFIDIPDREQLAGAVERVAAQEAVCHDRIAHVIKSTTCAASTRSKPSSTFRPTRPLPRAAP